MFCSRKLDAFPPLLGVMYLLWGCTFCGCTAGCTWHTHPQMVPGTSQYHPHPRKETWNQAYPSLKGPGARHTHSPLSQKGPGARHTHPSPRQNDRHLRKHYLVPTSLVSGNNKDEYVWFFSPGEIWVGVHRVHSPVFSTLLLAQRNCGI